MSLIQKPSNIWRYQEKSHQPYWIVQKAFWFTIFLWNFWFTNSIASCRGKRTFRWKSHSWARTQRTGPGRPPPASSSWSTPAGPWPPSSGTPASQPQPPASAALPPGLWPQLASAQETVVSAATTWVGQRASRASEAATGWEEWTEPASWVASVAVATAEAPQVSGWGPPPWSSWSPRRTGMRGAGARPRRPPPSPWSKGCTGPETLLRRLGFAASAGWLSCFLRGYEQNREETREGTRGEGLDTHPKLSLWIRVCGAKFPSANLEGPGTQHRACCLLTESLWGLQGLNMGAAPSDILVLTCCDCPCLSLGLLVVALLFYNYYLPKQKLLDIWSYQILKIQIFNFF